MKKHQSIHLSFLSDHSIPVAAAMLLALSLTTAVGQNAKASEPAAPKQATTAANKPIAAADNGTVTGTFTLNGKAITLKHIYGRKREAWPMDTKPFKVDSVEELSCGIVEVIITNLPVSDAVLTSILQNEYHGSDKIRGICLTFEASGKHSFVHQFLLESGPTEGFGITQTNGEMKMDHGRVIGTVTCKNDENTESRVFKVSFDTGVKLQFSPTEIAERIPPDQFLDEFLRVVPGKWNVERWVGLGCFSASGTLTVVERSGPHEFRGAFHLVLSQPGQPAQNIEEDITITRDGTNVHFEGSNLRAGDSRWTRDVLNFELRKGLLVGGDDTDSVVLKKVQESPETTKSPAR
jgi:hypothetical protein